MTRKIRALVVDDSAFLRKVVSRMLARSPEIEVVGTARDGVEALELVERLAPDVLTLDLVMPRMNGVEFLREQARRGPVPVVVCSIAHESGEMALDAFDAGAVDFVRKPTALATDRVYEIADELVAKVIAAAAAGPRLRRAATEVAPAASASTAHASVIVHKRSGETRAEVIVLGISTGGPHALRQLVPRFPADFPVPLVIVLHMPVGYTRMYAERLDAASPLRVAEPDEGEPLRPGVAWLAPAGQHLTFVRDAEGTVRAHLDLEPSGTQHRPAVDVLFRSAAEIFGDRVLGVVMTGMGSDGLLGAGHVKARGGRIITEAEASCVVYGMPRAVDDAALSDRSAPLDQMADAIMELL